MKDRGAWNMRVESGGGIRKRKRNAQPLFRGESPGFVDLLFERASRQS